MDTLFKVSRKAVHFSGKGAALTQIPEEAFARVGHVEVHLLPAPRQKMELSELGWGISRKMVPGVH